MYIIRIIHNIYHIPEYSVKIRRIVCPVSCLHVWLKYSALWLIKCADTSVTDRLHWVERVTGPKSRPYFLHLSSQCGVYSLYVYVYSLHVCLQQLTEPLGAAARFTLTGVDSVYSSGSNKNNLFDCVNEFLSSFYWNKCVSKTHNTPRQPVLGDINVTSCRFCSVWYCVVSHVASTFKLTADPLSR